MTGLHAATASRSTWDWMGWASSREGRKASIISVSPKSYTMCSRMSLSACGQLGAQHWLLCRSECIVWQHAAAKNQSGEAGLPSQEVCGGDPFGCD